MKIINFVLLVLILSSVSAQNSIYLVTTNPAETSTISSIANGGGFTVTTMPSSQDVPAKFRFYNISSTNTYTYNVLRMIKTLNTQGVNTATTYFCVGSTCLPPNANTLSNSGDFIVLNPGDYNALITYFSELSTIGYSEVSYKIFNVNNPNDTLKFTMYYNPTLSSVKENNSILENVSVFPVPAADNISISGKVNAPMLINVYLSNILGQKIIKQSFVLNDFVFRKNIDVSALPTGVYFLTIEAANSGESLVSKKIIITK